MPASLKLALGLGAKGVMPHHCDRASPEVHLGRLEKLARERGFDNAGIYV